MVVAKKPRKPTRPPVAGKMASKVAATGNKENEATKALQSFKAARAAAAAAAEVGTTPSSPNPVGTKSPPPMSPSPRWGMPPSFLLQQSPHSCYTLPQPGMAQPVLLAAGSLGDRLGSTVRLGIDVINMALAGSLRLLGGMRYGGHEHGCGGHYGCCGSRSREEHCGGYDCCHVFERDVCCTPRVGNCCD